jgi:acyl-CoA reductase-like NAD-dependent aldehyde dehydrogenase
MELGGKDAMIVCDDADLDRAARTAVGGAFSNAGQTCMAVERVYVLPGAWDGFRERVLALTDELRVGGDDDSHVGPVTDPRQLPIIEARLEEAVAGGATILRGGRRADQKAGSWFEPTVVVDVPDGCALAQEETFGPVLQMRKVASEDEAVTRTNDSALGLSASVFSRDQARARRLATRLDTGGVVINDALVGAGLAGVPFGGEKQSGFGRLQGQAGFDEFSRRRAVVTDRFRGAPGLTAAMFTGRRPSARAVSRAIRLVWGRGGDA